MASATNSRPHRVVRAPIVRPGALAERIAASCLPAVPLLVLRLSELERIAWREGKAAAQRLERRSLRIFVETCARALRSRDVIAHESGSDLFAVALLADARSQGAALPADCRGALARLTSAVEAATATQIDSGWTFIVPAGSPPRIDELMKSALERGAQERERFAFFSTVGHELRTPLTSVRGYLETLLEERLPPELVRDFLKVAHSETLRMARLIDGMLDISMLDMGYSSESRQTDVLGVLRSAANAVAPMAAKRGTTIEVSANSEPLAAVGADCLVQVFVNLLENAIKHGNERGCVRAVVDSDRRYACIKLDDDGPGIAEAEYESIFSLTSRGSSATAPGIGIGLAVVRLLLERCQGDISVARSPLLGGAQFQVRIPIAAS